MCTKNVGIGRLKGWTKDIEEQHCDTAATIFGLLNQLLLTIIKQYKVRIIIIAAIYKCFSE